MALVEVMFYLSPSKCIDQHEIILGESAACEDLVMFYEAFTNPEIGSVSIILEYMDFGSLEVCVALSLGIDHYSYIINSRIFFESEKNALRMHSPILHTAY